MGWLKIFGIGHKSCKLVSKLSPLIRKTWGYESGDKNNRCIEKSDLICIKGVRNLNLLSKYVQPGSHGWFVLDEGPAFQQIFKFAWGEIREKLDYCLVFHISRLVDKSFYYELLAYKDLIAPDSINHLIEIIDETGLDTKTTAFSVLKGLFYLMLVPSLICIDFADIKRVFSHSFLIKATSLNFNFANYKSVLDGWLCKLNSQPKFLLVAVFGSSSATLDEIYEIIGYLITEITRMGEDFKRDEDFCWSCFVEDDLPQNYYQLSLFWA